MRIWLGRVGRVVGLRNGEMRMRSWEGRERGN